MTAAALVAGATAAAAEEPAEQPIAAEPLAAVAPESEAAASGPVVEPISPPPAPAAESATAPAPADTATTAELAPTDVTTEPPTPELGQPAPVTAAQTATASPSVVDVSANEPAAPTSPEAAFGVAPPPAYYGTGKVTVEAATGFYHADPTRVGGAVVTMTDTANGRTSTCTTNGSGYCLNGSPVPLDGPNDEWVVTQDSAPVGFGLASDTPMTASTCSLIGSAFGCNHIATLADPVPQINDDAPSGPQNSPIDIPVLTNDESHGANLEVKLEPDEIQPNHGTVVLTGCPPGPCTVRYTPDIGYVGDDLFTYTAGIPAPPLVPTAVGNVSPAAAADPYFVGQASARVTVSLNDLPPTAGDTSAETSYGEPVSVGVLGLASAAAGNSVTLSGATTSGSGAVTVNADGSVTYTPASGFSGAESFTYTVSDGKGGSASGTVSVTVGPGPVPSIAQTPQTVSYAVPAQTAGDAELPRTGLNTTELLDLSLALLAGGVLVVGAEASGRRRWSEDAG